MPAIVGSLRALLSANVAQFATDMGKAGGVVDKFVTRFAKAGERMRKIGQTLTLSVTAPIALFAVQSVKAFANAEASAAKVDGVIKTMGKTAGFTAAQLKDMAARLEESLNVDADDILKDVTANLLTFGKVQGEVFKRGQDLAIDLSRQFGTDLQSATIQLGKALNDPVKGITALSRVGVSFSEVQKEQIKQFVKTNDLASAQAIILDELDRELGQAAETWASTTEGQLAGAAIAWENLQETWGEIIAQILPDLTAGLKDVGDWLNSIDDDTKKWILTIGGIAAALGPALIAFGLFASALKQVAWVVTALVIPALSALLRHPIIAGGVILGAGLGYLAEQLGIIGDEADDAASKLDKLLKTARQSKNIEDLTATNPATGEAAKPLDALKASFDQYVDNKFGPSTPKADAPTLGVGDKPRAKVRTAREVAGAAKAAATDLRDLTDAALDAERAVSDFGGRGLSPLADRLREVDERYQDLKTSIERQVAESAASAASSAEGASAMAKLKAQLVELEKAHGRATEAVKAQYAAEQKLAALDFQDRAAAINAQTASLRDALSTSTMTEQGEALKQAEQKLQDERINGARAAADIEMQLAEAQRSNDQEAVERFGQLLALQNEYNAAVDATTAAQLVAAGRIREAWTEFASQLSDQLSDMIVDWKFDLDSIRDVFGDIAKKMFLKPFLESALGGFGDWAQGLISGGLAGGGIGWMGSTYLVGEEGPELVSFNRTGHVTPAGDTAELMGGHGPTNVYQTIMTPDADSFRKSKRQVAADTKRAINFA